MNKKWMMALLFTAFTASIFAQPETEDKKPEKKKIKKEESIIIKKKGGNTEKVTVVVDGEKVTVNGKPMEEFKDEDIEIIRGGGDRITTLKRMNGRPFANADDIRDVVVAGFPNNKAVLGVSTEKIDQGAKITEVSKESAAEKAGLKIDDVITKLNDTKIEDADGLYKAVGKFKPEEKVIITYLRNGKQDTATATLGKNKSMMYNFNKDFNFEMPEIATAPENWTKSWGGGQNFAFAGAHRKPKLGLQVQDLEEGKGVKVLDVDEETPAAKAGLKKDDVITEVNGKEVADVDEVKAATKDIKDGDTLQIKFKREGKNKTADIKFPKKLKTAGL